MKGNKMAYFEPDPASFAGYDAETVKRAIRRVHVTKNVNVNAAIAKADAKAKPLISPRAWYFLLAYDWRKLHNWAWRGHSEAMNDAWRKRHGKV